MTWFKVDDKFHSSPKVFALRAGKRYKSAGFLWTIAGSWSADNLTDGFVPKHVVQVLGFTDQDATELVRVALWDKRKNGYQFHDWPDYQPLKKEVLARRQGSRDRVARYRSAKKDATEDVERTQPVTRNTRVTKSVPSRPVPVPTRRNPKDISDQELQAFGEGFDLQTVAQIFSAERDAAKMGKYRLTLKAHEDAMSAAQWALEEASSQEDETVTPVLCTQLSARSYFKYGSDWHQENRHPFGAWAKDPGSWLALGMQQNKKQQRSRG